MLFCLCLASLYFCLVLSIPLPFPFGPGTGDTRLPAEDETAVAVNFNPSMPVIFFGQQHTTIYVDINGALWLDSYFRTVESVPKAFPVLQGNQMIACYWADADASVNNGGAAYYRLSTAPEDWSLAASILRAWHPEVSLDGTAQNRVLLIATWHQLTFSAGTEISPTNTFQCALVSDGRHSYVILAYEKLTWTNSPWFGGDECTGLGGDPVAAVGLDSGTAANIVNFTAPFSMTADVLTLTGYSNLRSLGRSGLQQPGLLVLVDDLNIQQNTPYQLPANIQYKTCRISGDPHYFTFDGVHLEPDFGSNPNPTFGSTFWTQTPGTYVLAATTDCTASSYVPFVVYLDVDVPVGSPPEPRCTYPRRVTVELYLSTIDIGVIQNPLQIVLDSDSTFSVNGKRFTPPADQWDCKGSACIHGASSTVYAISVRKTSSSCLSLSTNFGMFVTHCPYIETQVTLPVLDGIVGNLIGFCGNMNEDLTDDERCPVANYTGGNYYKCWTQDLLSSMEKDAQRPGVVSCPQYGSTMNSMYTKRRNEVRLRKAQTLRDQGTRMTPCNVLLDDSGPFALCNDDPSLAFYVYNCVADFTITGGDMTVACLQMSNFAKSCMSLHDGIALEWRTVTGCDMVCPSNSHYEARVKGCPSTCSNPTGLAICDELPVEGCVCDEGYVLSSVDSGSMCVLPSQCSYCFGDLGEIRLAGESWRTSDCSRTCFCDGANQAICTPNPCSANAKCVSSGFSAICECEAGYFGDGGVCSATNNCNANPCQNGATCEPVSNGYRCTCSGGFTGALCDTLFDYCVQKPCLHDGKCTTNSTGYTCICNGNYTGDNCEVPIDFCLSYPCLNGGTCTSRIGAYWCQCSANFTGSNCERSIFATTTTPQVICNATPTPVLSQVFRMKSAGDFGVLPPVDCTSQPSGLYPNALYACSPIYYMCAGGTWVIPCPSGLFYDTATQACVSSNNVPACNAVNASCSALGNGYYNEPEAPCSAQYFECSNGAAFSQSCSSNHYFDIRSGRCLCFDSVSTCTDVIDCTTQPDGLYADPVQRCSQRYFGCFAGVAYPSTCPQNLYYDTTTEGCLKQEEVSSCS